MGHVMKTDNGKYRGTVRDKNGRRYTKTFDRSRAAHRWVAREEVIQTSDPYDSRRRIMSYETWMEEYWPMHVRNLRPRTQDMEESALYRRILPYFGKAQLERIDGENINKWIGSMADEGLSAPTIRTYYRILRGSLKAAHKLGYLPTLPTGVKLPPLSKVPMQIISAAEMEKLALEVDDRYKALILMLGFGGLRFGEAAFLRPSHLKGNKLRIEGTLQASVTHGVYQGPPKTRAGHRTITLPNRVLDPLREHMIDYPGEFIFTNSSGGPLNNSNFRRRQFLPALERCDLPPMKIHGLRHSAISMWIESGADILVASRRAGHQNPAFTLRTYGHILSDHDEGLAEALDAL